MNSTRGQTTKYVFVTGGVVSSLGKGIAAASLGRLLVERGLQVMNVEVVGDAYAIASNYLRKAGAIPDTFATDERLLEIIVNLFQRGEFNRTNPSCP